MLPNITIHNVEIAPGQREVVKISVGRLPSGNVIKIQAHVYRSPLEGPVVLVLAGVHGDEINGVEIVRRAIAEGRFENLRRGTVIAIPILNIYGFINFSREVPDGKDINRSFPGNMNGSLASRVARMLTKKVLPLADVVVDFHTGGQSHYNYPQIRYTRGDQKSENLARAFAPPYLVIKPTIPKSLRRVAHEQGKPVLVFEGGESLRYDGFSIEKGLAGIQRLLFAQDMVAEAAPVPEQTLAFRKTTWIRSPRAGMFLWNKCSGHRIYKGEVLGIINDPYGDGSIKVIAPREGYLIGHNNAPVVSQGDALFHLGYDWEGEKG
ncbi:MAG: succinylglutamate desuccinylase/aspartoacylase family protein [Lewinellaceae bacterium]|nr:succinylglutamate desuccinylase/aspartoacylase family protein [Phaeodactylibacter sp.]MCB9035976.1 succinylglutamate desuccinylase/aspartoacylase family protein [Lewinellaceae bacterium]